MLMTVGGVLPDEQSRRLLTGSDRKPMTFAEAAAARLMSVPGAEFKAVPLPTPKEARWHGGGRTCRRAYWIGRRRCIDIFRGWGPILKAGTVPTWTNRYSPR
jgi:hypothetical protein